MYPIAVDEEITVARHIFQGAYGILAGTRCRVLAIQPPQNPGQALGLTVQPGGAKNGGLIVRMTADDTMEGLLNDLGEKAGNLLADLDTLLDNLDELEKTYPDLVKTLRDQTLLKMTPSGQAVILNRLKMADVKAQLAVKP
jgi:hypothetical protein